MEAKSTNETPRLSKEQEKRWKEFIKKIRQNVPPPIPATRNRKEVMDEIGVIHVDEDAVNDLRLISTLSETVEAVSSQEYGTYSSA